MAEGSVAGVERAIFGAVPAEAVTAWLDRQVRRKLSLGVRAVEFRAGRLAAVYGLRLSDGTGIVAKVHRTADGERLAAAAACQRLLAEAGYPCPQPLGDPLAVDGRVLVLETRLERGVRGDAHRPGTRRAMARALCVHIALLRSAPPLRSPRLTPLAWADYAGGPWPAPHDPIFDFSATPAGFAWLDALARAAAATLRPRREPDALGHGDWVCQNLRFAGDAVSAAYDWDSVMAESEPVLVGLAAGAHPEGSVAGAAAPAPAEVAAFLADYEDCRGSSFTAGERAAAAAAATWVLAYNARCNLAAAAFGVPAGEGSPLRVLARHRAAYLTLGR
ncbi:MAG TPA: hypothetical protein VFL91_20865 [Thermomicrobiales bacterium]|nr:hypothetical protein [Thermomicrobiales bacterium]